MTTIVNNIQSLIAQRKVLKDRVEKLDDDKSNSLTDEKKLEIEKHIRLLMHRMNSINSELYNICDHKYGEMEYGYKTCKVCGYLKSSRHA